MSNKSNNLPDMRTRATVKLRSDGKWTVDTRFPLSGNSCRTICDSETVRQMQKHGVIVEGFTDADTPTVETDLATMLDWVAKHHPERIEKLYTELMSGAIVPVKERE